MSYEPTMPDILLVRARNAIHDYVHGAGVDCNHDAGFCMCNDKNIIIRIDDWLIHHLQPADFIYLAAVAARKEDQQIWRERAAEAIVRYVRELTAEENDE